MLARGLHGSHISLDPSAPLHRRWHRRIYLPANSTEKQIDLLLCNACPECCMSRIGKAVNRPPSCSTSTTAHCCKLGGLSSQSTRLAWCKKFSHFHHLLLMESH